MERDQGGHWETNEESTTLVWVIVLSLPREQAVEIEKKDRDLRGI